MEAVRAGRQIPPIGVLLGGEINPTTALRRNLTLRGSDLGSRQKFEAMNSNYTTSVRSSTGYSTSNGRRKLIVCCSRRRLSARWVICVDRAGMEGLVHSCRGGMARESLHRFQQRLKICRFRA
jgi:hypothetical protein